MVGAAAAAGCFLCVAPGIMVLVFFFFFPWRVLLHGEPIMAAAKASAKSMAMLWPRVLMAVLAILLVALLFNNLVAVVVASLGGGSEWHISNAFAQASMVWMNAALLALFQWMEAEAEHKKAANP
jgi:hypothetical protein